MIPLIIANWKLNKTLSEAADWLETFQHHISNLPHPTLEIVICPSFVVLSELKRKLKKLDLPIKLGAQTVSQFDKGQYTGEISAEMLQGLVNYVIIGHSERRKRFGETDQIIAEKAKHCGKYGIIPILCVSNLDQLKGHEKAKTLVVAYEPLEAISTEGEYHPDDPGHANEIAGKIKEVIGSKNIVLYGGSVHKDNAKDFVAKENIDGLLVGQASLDPCHFAKIIETTERWSKSKN